MMELIKGLEIVLYSMLIYWLWKLIQEEKSNK